MRKCVCVFHGLLVQDGAAALHLAAKYGHEDIVRALLSADHVICDLADKVRYSTPLLLAG